MFYCPHIKIVTETQKQSYTSVMVGTFITRNLNICYTLIFKSLSIKKALFVNLVFNCGQTIFCIRTDDKFLSAVTVEGNTKLQITSYAKFRFIKL